MAGGSSQRKKLGQCFLIDHLVVGRIVAESGVKSGERVLEIGPGHGFLTQKLLDAGFIVHGVEIDGYLYKKLSSEFVDDSRITIERGNGLKFDYATVEAPYHVVSNLPYSVSVPLIKEFIKNKGAIASMTLMTQKEVGKRLVAGSSDSHYGSLSVFLSYHCERKYLFTVPPESFRPAPKVESSVIRLVPRSTPPVELSDEDAFFSFVHSTFLHRRKTLRNNLLKMVDDPPKVDKAIEMAQLHTKVRPENVSLEQFAKLYACM